MKRIKQYFWLPFLITVFTIACKKEENDSFLLTCKPWIEANTKEYTYINDVLDTVRIFNSFQKFKFSTDSLVEYSYTIVNSPPLVGKWWINENKKLTTNLVNQVGYHVLSNATIIKLTRDSLVLQTRVLNVYSSWTNDVIKHVFYEYYIH